jgi:hypothetical protein
MLNGDAQHSFEGEPSYASDPLPYQRLEREGGYHMGILVS